MKVVIEIYLEIILIICNCVLFQTIHLQVMHSYDTVAHMAGVRING